MSKQVCFFSNNWIYKNPKNYFFFAQTKHSLTLIKYSIDLVSNDTVAFNGNESTNDLYSEHTNETTKIECLFDDKVTFFLLLEQLFISHTQVEPKRKKIYL